MTKNGDRHIASPHGLRRLAPIGLGIAGLSAVAEIMAGPGTRFGLWPYGTGLRLLGAAAIAGGAAAILSFIAGVFSGVRKPALWMAVAGIIIGLVAAGIPWSWYRTAKQLPLIHDITTDTSDPPAFSAALAFRKPGENSASYGGPAVAQLQMLAYPDIQPIVLSAKPDAVYSRVLSVAHQLGWKIVSSDQKQGRIEATATTFWFGFKDDIVVRLTSAREGTRVDVRSASRVGQSDVGTNAKRVKTFLERMERAS